MLKQVILAIAAAIASLSPAGAQEEVALLPEQEIPSVAAVTGFHVIKDKPNQLFLRVIESDASADVANNPVTLFMVITNDAGGPDLQEHVWRLPQRIAQLKNVSLDKSALKISVIVDGPLDEKTGKAPEQSATIHVAYSWSKGMLNDKIRVRTSKP
jgi:hypothetical protein